jgi:catechol 2,3-dioxygenase-like lactoylglutathione lyase family enzyme
MNIFCGVNVVSIAVPDLQAARDFYQNTLGLGEPVHDLPEAGWIEFATGGKGGNLSITTEGYKESSEQRTTIVLETRDCKEAYEILKRKGVRCEEPVVFPGFVVFCTFYDPFGNKLQCAARRPKKYSCGAEFARAACKARNWAIMQPNCNNYHCCIASCPSHSIL